MVGHASESIAARDNPNGSVEGSNNTILHRLKQIEVKLAKLQPSQGSNNIVINACQSPHLKQNNVSTQTEPSCGDCDDVAEASADTRDHESTVHERNVHDSSPAPSNGL